MTRQDILSLLNETIPGSNPQQFTLKANFAVERAILVLYSRQTADEQITKSTSNENGMGFNSTDAGILSSFALQIQDSGYPKGKRLSPKQMAIARNKVQKYTRQLIEEATVNLNAKAMAVESAMVQVAAA